MKNIIIPTIALALALASCGTENLPGVEIPNPDTPDTSTVTPGDSTSALLYITFAGATNDTLEVLAVEPQVAFAVHASKGLQTVSAYAMTGDDARALGSAVTAFDNDTLYERRLTASDLNFGEATGLRVQAIDKAGKSLRATVALLLKADTVPNDTAATDTSHAASLITFLPGEAIAYGNVNPIIRFKVETQAGLKRISYRYYPAPDDMAENLATLSDLGGANTFVGEVSGLTAAKLNRAGAEVEVEVEEVNGAVDRKRISITRREAIDNAELRAFPGADGFGRDVTGGRGGSVYLVTNLNDAGAGSLRDAVSQTGRTVVFGVSGIIELSSRINVSGNITIAGQTAPGDGICVKNYGVVINGNNVIVRYLRFRMGDVRQSEDDALGGRNRSNLIIDHCSVSWGTDETASFYDNTNFSMQWCVISESLRTSVHEKGSHGYGGIWGGKGASFHHNLLAHHDSRNPRFCGSRYSNQPDVEKVDFRNNVVYNWGSNSGYAGEGGVYNMVNNYYKSGRATSSGSVKYRIFSPNQQSLTDGNAQTTPVWGKFWLAGNYVNGYSNVTADNWQGLQPNTGNGPLPGGSVEGIKLTAEFAVPQAITHTAEIAYERVLSYVGASYRRDNTDARIANELSNGLPATNRASNGTTKIGLIDTQSDVGGWDTYASLPAPLDTDNDGMPDAWELANSLDPNNAADRNSATLCGGYTNLEVYLAWLVEHINKSCRE
ncbi:MAG: hypothetical protein LBS63_05315 [Prevotellaceae bacterium]|nr:hypothetical protein [Prevotellaceae bacterium]